MNATEYQSKAQVIYDEIFPQGKFSASFNNAAEMKLIKTKLNQSKKELKHIKREIAQELQQINATYANKRANHATHDLAHSITSAFLGSKSKSKGLAARNNMLRREQLRMRDPYERVSKWIDGITLSIDELLLRIDAEWLSARHQESKTTP
jgi:hypothetical protein